MSTSRILLVKGAEERATAIKKYISDHPECDTGFYANAFQNNSIDQVKVYSLPRRLLRLNPVNGRFKAELDVIIEDRKKAGKSLELDPNDPEDVKTLRDMLKGVHPKNAERANAYKKLLDNIREVSIKTKTNGQEVPGLITYDGIYVNGNRRDTVMEELSDPTKNQKGEPLKFHEIRVGILRQDVTAYDLWKNEAKEQISQESREEYDYVNSALEIKRGHQLLIDQGFSDKRAKEEIAKTLYGRDAEDVENYLKFLEITDIFLKRVKRPGQYRFVQESGNESGEKGIATILQEVAKIREKNKSSWDADLQTNWFKSVAIFCLYSKIKPTVTDSNGKQKKLSFGHREFRVFQKKAMATDDTRKRVFSSPVLDKIDWVNPSKEHALDFHKAIANAQNVYDVQEDISDPLMLLEKATESLSKVSKDLNSSHRASMVKIIKEHKGEHFITDIKQLIADISKKLSTK